MRALLPLDRPIVAEPVGEPHHLQRQRTHPCDRFVRKVKGKRFQLRLRVGTYAGCKECAVNCGLYETEEAAVQAKNALTEQMERRGLPWTPLGIWEGIKVLIGTGVIPSKVLPMWVFRTVRCGQVRYGAKVRVRGLKVTGKTYSTPERAHRALASRLGAFQGRQQDEGKPRDLFWHFQNWNGGGMGNPETRNKKRGR